MLTPTKITFRYSDNCEFGHSKNNVHSRGVSTFTIFLSAHFLMEQPQLDFMFRTTHPPTHTFNQQSYIPLSYSRADIYTHYINFLSKMLMNFWTFGLLRLQHNIIIIIMSYHQHGYSWPSLATFPYRSSPLAGLLSYILCSHTAAVCMFELVVRL